MRELEEIDNLISNLDNNFISEAHVVAEIYHKIKSSSTHYKRILLEYPYLFDEKQKCDIFIDSTPCLWIEVKGYFKTETSSTRSKKHTKEESSPYKDIEKLSRLMGIDNNSIKMLFIYQNIEYNPVENNSWDCIRKKCEDNKIIFKRLVVL
jgi:hypothetical protein